MKICIFTIMLPVHYLGGMQYHAQILSEGLVKNGHDVTVITTAHPHGKKYEDINGVKVYFLEDTAPGTFSKSWWIKSVEKFEELNEIKKFDIICDESFSGLEYIRKNLKEKYNIPFVTILYGTALSMIRDRINQGISIRTGYFVIKKIFDWLFVDISYTHSVDAIIVVSQKLKNRVHSNYLVSNKKIFVVYYGIDTDKFNPYVNSFSIQRKYRLTNDNKIILFVGRLVKEKGAQYIIQALPDILKEIENVKLLILGDGDYSNELKQLSIKLGISENVIFCGAISPNDLPYYYNLCDAFVNLTINRETFGLVLNEAMSCGKPVIAPKMGAISELIDNYENGILIMPKDVKSLTENIIKILKDQSLADKLGKNARKKVLKQFSLDRMIEDTLKVFKSVINK